MPRAPARLRYLRPVSADHENLWRSWLADPRHLARLRRRLPVSPFLTFVDWLERPLWRRVLVVGCGVSTELAAIAHAGYEVLGFDVSEVAVGHLRQHPASREDIASWMMLRRTGGSEERMRTPAEAVASLAELGRPGGSMSLFASDLLDVSLEAPVDIVYCPWSWQPLDDARRKELPRRAYSWLAPGGACLVATTNLGVFRAAEPSELHAHFRGAGFFQRFDRAEALRARPLEPYAAFSKRRDAEYASETLRALARLDAGERMYDVWNASG